MTGPVLSIISLARRAGCVESGHAAVQNVIEKRKAKLVIIASDAADRTKKNFEVLAGDAGIPLIIYGSKDIFSRILNKPSRSVVAITDENFKNGIVRAMEKGEA
ncbi:MAG: L7Ae/L30e/S12e/Gadd45 family ribosomal protein [Bacillota bacterium]